ncbi:bifunctional phosphoribosylaminoimidazolecarboxamide formyltransferase/IMP cyclohydrolase [Alicyclobacillus tolerans]|uniref:bifunctional phosphoribosylaminoimidazolecarboxamide formyltransferase/IMP cyclohydrolase n=1 Tax=Alicyclobacillus tolerans TaxID=90970 RepID=UPI003B77A6A7
MARYALVSVFDKTGVVELCQRLVELGYGILSTGGTATHLRNAGLAVKDVEEHTGFPEMLDGRVKTLHPRIHAGLLALRNHPQHQESLRQHQIDPIDLVVVNLYPFTDTVSRQDATFEECIEMIDIGGPSMLRAAAKNFHGCIPLVDPADYKWVLDKLAEDSLTATDRQKLAAKVFAVTAAYDGFVADYLLRAEHTAVVSDDKSISSEFPMQFHYVAISKQSLRYGENPHQAAHFYRDLQASPASIAAAQQLQGKELSYNNIQDADAAIQILRGLDDLQTAAVVAVKHMNPCGIGLGETLEEAYARAYEADPVSIFGGIVALNRVVNRSVAEKMAELFLEIIIAPDFTSEALAVLARKKNVRLLTVDMAKPLHQLGDVTFRRVSGGLLVQEVDTFVSSPETWRVVTHREPSEEEWRALQFAWRTVRYVKSNAIVVANAFQTLGIGPGQTNRVGAAEIALRQAGSRAVGAVLASDAFFPMRDTVDAAASAGIAAIVQPGGSIRDAESVEAANEKQIAMVFTGERHFLH